MYQNLKKFNQMKKIILASLLSATAFFAQASTVTYVGSWSVGDGPDWQSNPLAYSGTGAAELLFGAGTYVISTVDNLVANINNMAHYAIIGVGFADFSESYFRGVEGVAHYQDVYIFSSTLDTVSSYVSDFGAGGVNYAFRVSNDTNNVPEPGSLALIGLGFAGLAAARRRKSV